MMPRNCCALRRRHVGVVAHHLRERADRGQRRAQLVRHRGHEIVLQAVEALAAARWRRAARRSRAPASAISPRARASRRAAAKPRRGCASRRRAPSGSSSTTAATITRAEALPIAPASCVSTNCTSWASAGICSTCATPRCARVVGEQPLAPRSAPRKRARQLQQLAHAGRGRARTPARRRCRPRWKTSTNSSAWLGLARRRRARQRHRHIGRRRWPAGSRTAQCVRLSRPARPNSCSGLSSAMPHGPVVTKPIGQPARLRERGQQQRVGPQREAGAQAGQRAGARAALPVHAAEHRRRELRHRGEADQADADQRIGLAGERGSTGSRAAARATIAPRRMPSSSRVRSPRGRRRSAACAAAAASRRSLQTIVETAIASTITMPVAADRPPMKANSASAGWPRASGSDSTKVSASHAPGPKCSRPPKAIGSTNRLISSRYSGNSPGRASQMPLVDVLDHHHLELARQEDDRQHRQHDQREPLLVGEAARSCARPSSGGQSRARPAHA